MKLTFLKNKLKPGISDIIDKQRWYLEFWTDSIWLAQQNQYFTDPENWRDNGCYYGITLTKEWHKPKYQNIWYDGAHESFRFGPIVLSWCR